MKKLVLVLAVMTSLCGIVFASGHTKTQVQNFVREYEQTANEYSQAVNVFVKNVESQQAQRKFHSALEKANDLQAKAPYYMDELTDADLNKLLKANEKISTAAAKFQSFLQKNNF